MPVTVNGVALTEEEIALEVAQRQDDSDPVRSATIVRVLHHLLEQEAQRLNVAAHDPEQMLSELLQRQAPDLEPDESACRRFYEAHPGRFCAGAYVEAGHILLQVTPKVQLQALRRIGEDLLEQVLARPERFAELARRYSNCPSAAAGGSLGQIRRGETVPEFERALFAMEANRIHPALVQSRHGLHIVRVGHIEPGQLLPFEKVCGEIAQLLRAMGRDTAWRQYVKVLVGRASITGLDLGADAGAERLTGAGF